MLQASRNKQKVTNQKSCLKSKEQKVTIKINNQKILCNKQTITSNEQEVAGN